MSADIFARLQEEGPGKTTYIVSATLRYYGNGYIWQAILT